MGFGIKKNFSGMTKAECDEAAFNRVVRSVSAAEQSTLKMRKKMEFEGYPSDSIDFAIEKACRIGAIDDRRYCECLIRSTSLSGKGLKFALEEVESLGVDPYTLDSYNEYLDEGQDSEVERAIDYLSRHVPRAKDFRGACYRKLVTRGYSSATASTASRLFSEQMDPHRSE